MKVVITTQAKKDLEKLDNDTRKRVYIALEHLITGQRVDILSYIGGQENLLIHQEVVA